MSARITRSTTRAAGGAIQFTGITTNSLGKASSRAPRQPRTTVGPSGPVPAAPNVASSSAAAAPAARARGGRKNTRGRGRGGRGRAQKTNDSRNNALTMGENTNDAADDANAAAAGPSDATANAPSQAAEATESGAAAVVPAGTMVDASTQVDGECNNCALLRRRVARRDRDIARLEAEIEQVKAHRAKIIHSNIENARCLAEANAQLYQLGGRAVNRNTPPAEANNDA